MGSGPSAFSSVDALLLAAGVPAFTYLFRIGFLRPRSLAAAPPRRAGLGLIELLAGISLFLLGQVLVGWLLFRPGIIPGPKRHTPAPVAATAPASAPARSAATSTTMPRPASAVATTATAPATTAPPAPPEATPLRTWRMAELVVLEQAGGELPVVVLILLLAGKAANGWRELGVVPRHGLAELRMGVVCCVTTLVLVFDVIILTQLVGLLFHVPPPTMGHELLQAMNQSTSAGATAVMVISAVVAAPLLEEMIFRGLVQTSLLTLLGPRNRWAVVAIAAGVFMFMHVGSVAWQALPGLFFLGLVLGWLYESTGSLLAPVLVHMGFNAFNTGLTLLGLG